MGQQWSGNSKQDRAGYGTGRDSERKSRIVGQDRASRKGKGACSWRQGSGGKGAPSVMMDGRCCHGAWDSGWGPVRTYLSLSSLSSLSII